MNALDLVRQLVVELDGFPAKPGGHRADCSKQAVSSSREVFPSADESGLAARARILWIQLCPRSCLAGRVDVRDGVRMRLWSLHSNLTDAGGACALRQECALAQAADDCPKGDGVPLRVLRAAAAAVCAVLLLSTVAWAQLPSWLDAGQLSGQVVTVRVYKEDQLAAEGAGVMVGSEGDVLTSAAVLDAGPRATVTAKGSGELTAEIRLKEKASGLGVLRAAGLQGAGLPLSLAALEAGARIFALTPEPEDDGGAFAAGAAGAAVVRPVRDGEVRLLRHNAMIAARGYGSPVIDECGRVVALNVPDPEAFTLFTAPRNVKPKSVVFALSAGDIASRLESLGIGFTSATVTCASAEARAQERARGAAEEAEEKARQTQEKAQQAEEEAQRAQAETESAREESQQAQEAAQQAREEARQTQEKAQAETQRAREEAERLRVEARQAQEEARRAEEQSADARAREAEERRQSEKLRRLAVWGGAAGGALLLALLVSWAVSGRRRRRAMRLAEARAAGAEQEAAAAQRRVEEMPGPAPFDCVLTGADSAGTPHALNLRRGALGDPAGVIVGRNPAGSSHVVTDPSVSREHARLYVENGVLYVEDLGSTNGTALNGRALVPGERERAGEGDELTLGSVAFQIDLKA